MLCNQEISFDLQMGELFSLRKENTHLHDVMSHRSIMRMLELKLQIKPDILCTVSVVYPSAPVLAAMR